MACSECIDVLLCGTGTHGPCRIGLTRKYAMALALGKQFYDFAVQILRAGEFISSFFTFFSLFLSIVSISFYVSQGRSVEALSGCAQALTENRTRVVTGNVCDESAVSPFFLTVYGKGRIFCPLRPSQRPQPRARCWLRLAGWSRCIETCWSRSRFLGARAYCKQHSNN